MSRPPQSVLIVEDAEDSRELFAFVFEAAGFRAVRAGSVGEALQVMCSTSVDAVVTDYHLPDGDGLAMLEAAAQQGLLHCDIPAVLCTASALVQRTARRVIAVFIKPVDIEKLVGVVHEALATGSDDDAPDSAEMAS